MDRDKRLVPAKPNPIRIAPPLPEQLGCTTPEKLYLRVHPEAHHCGQNCELIRD
jgi:hypothetical protein